MTCELCSSDGGQVLWRGEALRVVAVDDPQYPGFCRVIWNAHVTEMTDLEPSDRDRLMRVVYAVEAAVRTTLKPHKINLASLGNVVPHLHWHVIPRWREDAHFPAPIWAAGMRPQARPRVSIDWQNSLRERLDRTLRAEHAGE